MFYSVLYLADLGMVSTSFMVQQKTSELIDSRMRGGGGADTGAAGAGMMGAAALGGHWKQEKGCESLRSGHASIELLSRTR